MIPVWRPDPESIAKAAQALQAGRLIAMPTETVYGLAANALDARALARIFAVKGRPFFDPLIVHVHSMEQARTLVLDLPPKALALMERFWPGPLTVVLPRAPAIPDLATSGLPSVALRYPRHPVATALLRQCGFPLAAPSANPFGGLSPTRPEHVAFAFDEGVDAVIDGGPCEVGLESTIIGFHRGEPTLLRAGGLALETLQECVGAISLDPGRGGDKAQTPPGHPQAIEAPGQLPWHYAPSTPLRLIAEPAAIADREGRGLLSFRGLGSTRGYLSVEVLSPSGDLIEAAARLFSCLHRLDAQGLKGIDAETVPDSGLGRAILDRLSKASRRPAN